MSSSNASEILFKSFKTLKNVNRFPPQHEAVGRRARQAHASETQTVQHAKPPQHPPNPEAPAQRRRQPADPRCPELRLQEGPAEEGTFTDPLTCRIKLFHWFSLVMISGGGYHVTKYHVTMTCLQASKRMESGEISREEFLNMAHQIKQLYQYQEEIQLRKDSWDESDFPVKKQPPLLSTPSSQPRPHEGMDPAELSYYEHKSKLRKTQVNHRPAGEEWEGEETPEITDKPGHSEKMGGGQSGGHPPPHKYNRGPRDRPGERHMINKLAREQSFIT